MRAACGHIPSHLPRQLALIPGILEVIWPTAWWVTSPGGPYTVAQMSAKPPTVTLLHITTNPAQTPALCPKRERRAGGDGVYVYSDAVYLIAEGKHSYFPASKWDSAASRFPLNGLTTGSGLRLKLAGTFQNKGRNIDGPDWGFISNLNLCRMQNYHKILKIPHYWRISWSQK